MKSVNKILSGGGEKGADFQDSRNTINQIFGLRSILELVNKWSASLYFHFIDFEKMFDSVH